MTGKTEKVWRAVKPNGRVADASWHSSHFTLERVWELLDKNYGHDWTLSETTTTIHVSRPKRLQRPPKDSADV